MTPNSTLFSFTRWILTRYAETLAPKYSVGDTWSCATERNIVLSNVKTSFHWAIYFNKCLPPFDLNESVSLRFKLKDLEFCFPVQYVFALRLLIAMALFKLGKHFWCHLILRFIIEGLSLVLRANPLLFNKITLIRIVLETTILFLFLFLLFEYIYYSSSDNL